MAENYMSGEQVSPQQDTNLTPKVIEMGGTLNGVQVPKIEIDNTFKFKDGEELERFRTTRMSRESGAKGTILDHLGEKVEVKYDPFEVAIQTDMSNDDRRRRIDVLLGPFHKRVSSIVAGFKNPEVEDDKVALELEKLVDQRSDIVGSRLNVVPINSGERKR